MLCDWLCIGYDWAAETAKPIEMPFGRQSCIGSRTVCQMHVTLVPHGEYDRLIRVWAVMQYIATITVLQFFSQIVTVSLFHNNDFCKPRLPVLCSGCLELTTENCR